MREERRREKRQQVKEDPGEAEGTRIVSVMLSLQRVQKTKLIEDTGAGAGVGPQQQQQGQQSLQLTQRLSSKSWVRPRSFFRAPFTLSLAQLIVI